MRWVVQVYGLTIRNPQGDALLQDINFELAAGGSLALIGGSGAGKSTLGRALLGDLTSGQRHAGGRIICCGCEVLQATPRQLRQLRFRHTAWLGQDPAQELTPGMSVRRQLNEFHHGDASAIREMLASLGLPQDDAFLQRFPHQLSGGQRRRVALARVLLKRPLLLILDEPFAGLDRRHREQMMAELRQLQRQYRFALLLIGHQLNAVAEIAQRMLVLHNGQQLEYGDTRQLFATPKSPLLQAWLSPVTFSRPVATEGEPLLRVAHWHSGDSRRTAMPALSFALHPGQCLAVTGPSGIGKSTLARSLAGLNPPIRALSPLTIGRWQAMCAGAPANSSAPSRWCLRTQLIRCTRCAALGGSCSRRSIGTDYPTQAVWPRCCTRSDCPAITPAACRESSPAANSSAWRWRGRWRVSPACLSAMK